MLSYPSGSLADPRRKDPRIEAQTFCSELYDEDLAPGSRTCSGDVYPERRSFENGLRHGYVVELSERGVRIERPFFGGRLARRIQLEFELPEVDEIVWAAVEPCYDVVSRRPSNNPGELGGLIRTSGFRLVNAANRSRRMLRDVVFETRRRRATREMSLDLLGASCYARG